jgi:hypothetical protein
MKLGGRRFTAIHVDILRAVNAVTVPEEVASRTASPLYILWAGRLATTLDVDH